MEENKTIEQQEERTGDSELREVIEETISKIRTDSMLLGARAICQTILNKIYAFESSEGKKTANDYKRCVKDIKNFVYTGLSKSVNVDAGTEEDVASNTTQN